MKTSRFGVKAQEALPSRFNLATKLQRTFIVAPYLCGLTRDIDEHLVLRVHWGRDGGIVCRLVVMEGWTTYNVSIITTTRGERTGVRNSRPPTFRVSQRKLDHNHFVTAAALLPMASC